MTARTLAASTLLVLTLGVAADRTVAAEILIHSETAFTAGEQAFPSGAYRIQSYAANGILIRNVDTGRGAILSVLAQMGSQDEPPRATFRVNDGQYTLSEVYLPGMGGLRLSAAAKEQSAGKWKPVGK